MTARLLLAVCLFLPLSVPPAAADSGPAGSLKAGGLVLGDLRLNTDWADPDYTLRELRLDLFADAAPGDDFRLYFQGWLRSLGFPEAPQEPEELSFELKEAYADLYGFPLPAVDVRLGRQRIAWGRADKISIVDNLNPDDLEDPWDFGRHLASDALKLSWYGDRLTVQGVVIPIFTPARLETGDLLADGLPPDSTLSFTPLPGAAPDGATLGVRASFLLGNWDVACAYIRGRDDIFTVTNTVATGLPPAPLELTADYLRQQVVSVEISGMLGDLGLWAETALFVCEERELVTDLTAAFGPLTTETTRPYWKALAGLDFTFPHGIYLNVQVVRGLFSENSRESLGNYLLIGLEWPLPGGRVRLGPLGLALEIDDLENPEETWALIVNPELSIMPREGVSFIFGLRSVSGTEETRFGRLKQRGELYARGEFSF